MMDMFEIIVLLILVICAIIIGIYGLKSQYKMNNNIEEEIIYKDKNMASDKPITAEQRYIISELHD